MLRPHRRQHHDRPAGLAVADYSRLTIVQMRTPPKVATEMALAVLAYNLTRVLNIVGVKPMISAMRS